MTKKEPLLTCKKQQSHRKCGNCGKHVKPWKGSLKCDGWHWHRKCWTDFLRM